MFSSSQDEQNSFYRRHIGHKTQYGLRLKSSSADAPHRIVIRLGIVIRVPVVQVHAPSILSALAGRSTRPVISRGSTFAAHVSTS